jgi:diguanylate cyclase (GGDEF)-like protein
MCIALDVANDQTPLTFHANEDTMKLLIIDDDPLNLKLLRTQLESEGHSVVEATNGADAWTTLQQEAFDGVVSDIMMPRMDGFSLCMEVRGNDRLRTLPFVLYTSKYNHPNDVMLGNSLGVDAYIEKPAPVASILESLHSARERSSLPPVANDGAVLKLYTAALGRKLHEKRQLISAQAIQSTVTRILADAQTLGDAMPKLIAALCETTDCRCGIYWMRDDSGSLRFAGEWGIEPERSWSGATPPLAPPPLPEAAASTPAWTTDAISARFADAAPEWKQHLNGAALLLPIPLEGRIVAIIELYATTDDAPDALLLESIDAIGSQIGQFIARATAQDEVRRLAHYDYLTGLPNRYLLDDIVSGAIARAEKSKRPMAVMFIDLDGFKAVNDVHGHDAGDHALATFALRLRDCLRRSDSIARHGCDDAVARIGGDEFVAVIEDFREAAALDVIAQRILLAAGRPIDLAGPKCQIGASVGIGVFPQDGAVPEVLLKAADRAMYAAKAAGKNAYRFAATAGAASQPRPLTVPPTLIAA